MVIEGRSSFVVNARYRFDRVTIFLSRGKFLPCFVGLTIQVAARARRAPRCEKIRPRDQIAPPAAEAAVPAGNSNQIVLIKLF
jgi:hypothetical protein